MKKRFLVLLVIAGLLTAVPGALYAWTVATAVSDLRYNSTVPRIARGSSGSMHIAYYQTQPEWRVCYRYRAADGTYGPIEIISSAFSHRCDVIEDNLGRPHVVYCGDTATESGVLFHAYKNSGAWITSRITSAGVSGEDQPRMGKTSNGTIYLVYARSNTMIYCRTWNGSIWSAETYLGDAQSAYYQRPDISVDPSNNVHVLWARNTTLLYRKFNGSYWTAQQTIGTTTSNGFFAYPKIAAANSNNIMVCTFDQIPSSCIKYTYSTNGGTNWSALTYLNDGHYPNMDSDGSGNAYLAYEWQPGGKMTGYRKWDGSTWSLPVACSPTSRWQGWADIGVGTNGAVYVVYDDSPDTSGINRISLVSNPPSDTTPPTSCAPVLDDGATQSLPTFLHARWSAASDPESLIDHYEYSIGTSAGAANVVGWTNVGTALETTYYGSFNAGTYYFNVRAVNGFGLIGPVASSDGIQITATANPYTFSSPAVVSSSTSACENSMIANSGDGGLSMVYQDANGGAYPKVVYRKRSASGAWGSLEDVCAAPSIGTYPDIAEDSSGAIHVIFANSTAREGMDVFERIKSGGSWNTVVNISQNNMMDWYPRAAVRNNTVYLINSYGLDRNNETVQVATGTNGVWSAFTSLGTCTRYGTPDIVKSNDDVLHACWVEAGTFRLVYSRNTGSGWSTPVSVADAPGVPMPRITCDSNNRPAIVWLGSAVGSYWQLFFSRFNGSNWSTPEQFGVGHYPVIGGDSNGNIHIAYTANGTNSVSDIFHIMHNGIAWSVSKNVSNNSGASLRPALEFDNSGAVHVTWQDETNGVSQIMHASAPAIVLTGNITGYIRDSFGVPIAGATVSTSPGSYLTTTGIDGSYTLSNVAAGAYSVTATKSGYYSSTLNNIPVTSGGTATCSLNLSPMPGAISGFIRDNVGNAIAGAVISTNTGGYSTVSSADGSYTIAGVAVGTYSVTASAGDYQSQTLQAVVSPDQTSGISFALMPVERTILQAKSLALDKPLTIENALVTAVFPGMFYIEEMGRYCGIRVNWNGSVSPKDRVTITGKVSELSGERCISAYTVDPISSNNIVPLALGMANHALGGAANASQSGVAESHGLNNIGILIRTWGKVTEVGTGYIVVDDGSAGGVKVYWNGNVSASYVVVTGISACEIPAGESVPVRVIRATEVRSIQ